MAHKQQSSERKRGSIQRHGDGKWRVRVYVGDKMVGGVLKREYASKVVEGTYKQADVVRTQMLRELDEGEFIPPTKQTVQQYVDHWLTHVASLKVSERTLTMYRYMMERYVYPELGARKLDGLTPAHVQGLVTAMLNRKLGARIIRYTHVVLKSAFALAVTRRQLKHNPCEGVVLPTQEKKAPEILLPEQVTKILSETAGDRWGVLWSILLNTGMRPQEALALRWSDLSGHVLSISRALVEVRPGHYEIGPCKTPKSVRKITLPEACVVALHAHRVTQAEQMLSMGATYNRAENLIFATRTGTLLCEHNVNRAWKSMLKRLSLPEAKLYNCRHTHISWLLSNGAPVKAVSDRAGHASAKMTLDVYAASMPNDDSAVARLFDKLVASASPSGTDAATAVAANQA